MTKTEAKPVAESVNALFSNSPDGLTVRSAAWRSLHDGRGAVQGRSRGIRRQARPRDGRDSALSGGRLVCQLGTRVYAANWWFSVERYVDHLAGGDVIAPPVMAFAAAELADEGVEGGREEQTKAGDADHPEQHGRAERLPHFGAGSGRHRERGDP